MRIINLKRAIIILLMIGILAVVSGCVRYPTPEPEPPETDYQLEITVEVAGNINSGLEDDGVYYIGINPEGNTKPGPDSDLDSWQGEYYFIRLDDLSCNLYSKDVSASPISLNNYSHDGNELKIKFFLSNLGVLETSIDVNVVTADSNDSVYDYLDDCINISTTLYAEGEGISLNDLEGDEADFDIIKTYVEITNI